MIACDFIYYKPDSLEEAVKVYEQVKAEGKAPYYYSGGSEIITMARAGSIRPEAVIDLKGIPEMGGIASCQDKLIIGAACTLSAIKESGAFPMLGNACGRIADHTNQCRITLGGNLCGTIIYRETSLPLLIGEAEAVLSGPEGMRDETFNGVFDGKMRLREGEFVTQIRIPQEVLTAPYFHIKKTANEKVDYPLINITAARIRDEWRFAFSGICEFPFRSEEMESVLNNRACSTEKRAKEAIKRLPVPPLNDVEGTDEYRLFVLFNTLQEVLDRIEEMEKTKAREK